VTDLAEEPEPTGERERTPIADLSDRVGETVSVEAEVVGARQTGGPTVFELRDESGVVDAAAFVEAGVRAYPDVEVGDAVRLSGEVEIRRDELQVETEALSVLTDEEREAVERRLADALSEKARPAEVTPLAGHEGVADLRERIADAAEVVRRAVLATRPVVVRHPATADGYVAGAALERAVLPLVREEHARADAEYHYFDRRPLEGAVYDMDDATNDATRMLQDRDRHDEPLPLVVLLGSGSTVESADGLGLLSVYGAEQVVVDAATADPEVEEGATVVNPDLEGVDADDLSTGALAANLAAAVNAEVRGDLEHLPAVSYWEGTPETYVDLAADAGYDEDRVRDLREAVALEAYYQSYEDKRELITDILFSGEGGLAGHVAEQFREKLGAEVETAEANLERHETGGVRFAVLDADAYTHRFDFPPTPLLLDELHRRNRDGEAFVTVGIGTDELYVRTTGDVDLRAVADRASEIAPGAGIAVASLRDGRLEFLSGARDDVRDAVVAALAESV
jgi:RecJ-like exonuclease